MLETLQAIAAITLIDLAMSGDNALVIGMVARGLPKARQRQAIIFGAGAAVVLRVAAAAATTILLTIPWLQLVGGLALVAIAYRLVRPAAESGPSVRQVTTLRAAVMTIVAADFAMSLENVLGVAAAAHGSVALLVFGLALSIPIVVFGSGLVIAILDRFPRAMWLAAAVLVLTAADLILSDPSVSPLAGELPFAKELLGVTLLAVVVAARGWRVLPPALAAARSRGRDREHVRSRRAS
jgi:YjbE family integral membrane protein